MHADTGSPASPQLSDELRLLRMLHNVGATAQEKSLSVEEICRWTEMDSSTVQLHLTKLVEMKYVQPMKADEMDKYHVTLDGMRKVLSMYS